MCELEKDYKVIKRQLLIKTPGHEAVADLLTLSGACLGG